MKKQELIAIMAACIFSRRTSGQEQGEQVIQLTERAILDAQFVLETVYKTVKA